MSTPTLRQVGAAVTALAILGVPSAAADHHDQAVYVRPGAPGEPTERISASSLGPGTFAPHTEAERQFLQHMIVHHGQAVTMSDLAPDRAASSRVLDLAERIGLAQDGEIGLMQRWLRLRDEEVTDPHDSHHDHQDMPGMLSPEELDELAELEGEDFDVAFLEAMIFHHRGALRMVDQLYEQQGGRLEPNVEVIASEIVDVQDAEINRMQALLADLGAA